MYDAIVVGARCAGAPTAMLLARRGYRVLLLDRTSFPSDTLSTHYIHQPGVALLQRWGLLDRVLASNCPPVREQIFDVGPFALRGTPPPADGVDFGIAPRRTVLDKLLVEGAAAAGAEVRERFTVDEVLIDKGRVTGVRGHAAGGQPITERARIVVGADGLHSIVSSRIQAPLYNTQPAFSCAYYTYWGDLPVDGPALYPRPERMIIVAPTNDGQTIAIVYWPTSAFPTVRADIEGQFMAALDLVPELAERARGARRTERYRGSVDLRNVIRRPHGPGWALVGDAGYHKNPITAQGITDAFRDAELLAGAIDDGLAGRRPMEESLIGYERQRNEAVLPMYELTCQLARLEPPTPQMQQLFGALLHNQQATNRFIGTVAGTVPIPEFFAPENLDRIIGDAPSAAA